mgnify:CR=1 FL=1
MPLKIQARSIAILPWQTLEFPVFAKFLTTELDSQRNNCRLWYLAEDPKSEDYHTEKVDVVMAKAEEIVEPNNVRYVGSLMAASGRLHVFALRDSEKLPFQK